MMALRFRQQVSFHFFLTVQLLCLYILFCSVMSLQQMKFILLILLILLLFTSTRHGSLLTYHKFIKEKSQYTHKHTTMLSIEARGQTVSHQLIIFPEPVRPSAPGWRKAPLVSADLTGWSQRGVEDEWLWGPALAANSTVQLYLSKANDWCLGSHFSSQW